MRPISLILRLVSSSLQDISKDKRAGKENTTISDRMQHLVDQTEKDIRQCANSCNAYAKKRALSKVIQSSSWSDEFKGRIKGFTTRKREFEFELSLYIGDAVNNANEKLLSIEEKYVVCIFHSSYALQSISIGWIASSSVSKLARRQRNASSAGSSISMGELEPSHGTRTVCERSSRVKSRG